MLSWLYLVVSLGFLGVSQELNSKGNAMNFFYKRPTQFHMDALTFWGIKSCIFLHPWNNKHMPRKINIPDTFKVPAIIITPYQSDV